MPEPAPESRAYSVVPFRIAGSRGGPPSTPDVMESREGIRPLTDLMLGAAYANGDAPEVELDVVHELIRQLLQVDEIPDSVDRRIEGFNPQQFDLEKSAKAFLTESKTNRRRLLELVRKVCDADASVDLEENRYMAMLAAAVALSPSEYDDLVVEPARGILGPVKRCMDLILASVGLLAISLPMLFIALAIKVTSRGPVFFRQRRYGVGGKEISVFKFRSMTTADDGAVVKQASKGDARITPLGGFLRRTSLDELPQLFNVISGGMSLVGPRPHAVAHNQKYNTEIIEYALRHDVKPGITGWAQVNGWRGETDTLRKMVYRVEFDLHYIRNWSIWLDIKILWLTVFGRKVRQNAR